MREEGKEEEREGGRRGRREGGGERGRVGEPPDFSETTMFFLWTYVFSEMFSYLNAFLSTPE